MNTSNAKQEQLQKYKYLATALFLFMTVIYVAMLLLEKKEHSTWVGYIAAFAEAGMIGALADWFAVTALFHHPLGLKIPHTNLIQKSKNKIGDNLGNFLVNNFLNSKNIKPYIEKLSISNILAQWLSKEKNKKIIINELCNIIKNTLLTLEDKKISNFIEIKVKNTLKELEINNIISSTIEHLLNNQEHEKAITLIFEKIRSYIQINETKIQKRVKEESHLLIPKFVDNMIAHKITKGLEKYLSEIIANPNHNIRQEIEQQLKAFAEDFRSNEKWIKKVNSLCNYLIISNKILLYTKNIWAKAKALAIEDLKNHNSLIKKYLQNNITNFSIQLQEDKALRHKIDHWTQYHVYKYILRNAQKAGKLISNTIENWEGKELSQKLELEIGKDLQFIRINGTLVGGLMGLIIHTITQLLH